MRWHEGGGVPPMRRGSYRSSSVERSIQEEGGAHDGRDDPGEEGTPGGPVLHVTLEVDDRSWKLAFTPALAQRPELRQVGPRSVDPFSPGGGGERRRFWLGRWLVAQGVDNGVADSSSIEVSRRARRATLDPLSAAKLVRMRVPLNGRGAESMEHAWFGCHQ